MIEELKKLVSIESVARPGEGGLPYGAGPAAALEYVLQLCASFDFRTKMSTDFTVMLRSERARN